MPEMARETAGANPDRWATLPLNRWTWTVSRHVRLWWNAMLVGWTGVDSHVWEMKQNSDWKQGEVRLFR